jgi:toxin ParE1/3/4
MAYNIIVSPRAQKEIETAIEYYALHSRNATLHFIEALKNTYATLEINPFFRVRYKNIMALKINRFPYLLYFFVEENKNIVRVLSCFHSKRNPNKLPRIK